MTIRAPGARMHRHTSVSFLDLTTAASSPSNPVKKRSEQRVENLNIYQN